MRTIYSHFLLKTIVAMMCVHQTARAHSVKKTKVDQDDVYCSSDSGPSVHPFLQKLPIPEYSVENIVYSKSITKQLTDKQVEDIVSFYDNKEFPVRINEKIRQIEQEPIPENGDLKDIFPPQCDQLISQVADVVRSSVTDQLIEGPRDIRKSCPRWESLGTDDRKDFYVGLVTAMAMAESSCNNKARNSGAPNGTAFGYWQSTRPLSPTAGARWVMKQIHSQVTRSGLLFWPNSHRNYWAVLNPRIHAHKVQGLLKMIPSCAADAATRAYHAKQATRAHKRKHFAFQKRKRPLGRVALQAQN